MKKAVRITGEETSTPQIAAPPQTDRPVLLALPGIQSESLPERLEEASEPGSEQLYLLETGMGPRIETALLRELLARSPEMEKFFADRTEEQDHHHPLAGVNAYKHRLHALRCENVQLRLRVHELETQLSRMCATRGWQLLEKYRRWRCAASRWLRPILKGKNRAV